MTNTEVYPGDCSLDIGVVIKKELVLMVITKNKRDSNMERGPLKYQDTRFRFFRSIGEDNI